MMMSDQSSSVNDVAMRRCSKCRNHGVLVRLKGHKPFCRFRDCSCMACCRLEEKKVVTRIRKMQLATANVQTGPGQVDPVPEPPQQRPCSVRYHPYTYKIAKSQVDKPPQSLKETQVPPGLTPNHKPTSYYINNLQTKTLWEKTCDSSKMMQYTNITKTIIPKEPTPVTGPNVAKARKMEAQQPTYCMPGPNPTTGASVAKARKMEAQQPTYCMPGPNPTTGASVAKARKMEAQQPTYCMPGPNPATGDNIGRARNLEPQQPTYCMPAQLSSSNLTTQPSTTQQATWTGTKASEIYRTQCMDCPGPFQTTINTHFPTYTLLNPVSHVGLIFSSENTFWARQDQDMLIFNQQWNVQHTNY
ncbi:uncharacterized protein LOC111130972 isoform X1 [Crassostrea virginica]